MIVDTSALVAIIFDEPEATVLLGLLMRGSCRMSSATYFEAGMVIDKKAEDASPARLFDELMTLAEIEIVAFDEAQARFARDAYAQFGKGTIRPA